MIVVDTNYFLRTLVRPETIQDQQMSKIAAELLELVRSGVETIFVSDAVWAEVVFILSSKRHYGLPRADVNDMLRPIIQMTGCRFSRKRCALSALDLWESTPKISYVDALAIAYSIDLGVPIASFDAQIGKVPGIRTWTVLDD